MAKTSSAAQAPPLPPNHVQKRSQILEAAKAVLLRDGPAGCTSRVVAEELGLNKALMHYYFASWDEVVDTAMNELLGRIVDRINAAAQAGAERPPADRFAHIVSEYLAVFAEQPGLSLLWFDYWVSATRAGRGEMFVRIGDDLIALLAELLVHAGVPDAQIRARVAFSYVVGALVRSDLHGDSGAELQAEVEWLSAMGSPATKRRTRRRPAPRPS